MIIIDSALRKLQQDGTPIRVGMVGAGFMGRGFIRHVVSSVPGMQVVAIASRTLESAADAFLVAGSGEAVVARNVDALEQAIRRHEPAITDDPLLVCRAQGVDVVLEITGTIELGARVVLEAIRHGKHVVLMNAELDATLGPVLRRYADAAGVVYTGSDGDQPGVTMNLYRFATGIGVQPVLCGNIKGLHDPYRNPTTQKAFAERWGQSPEMVTSFADGTKISFEQALVANATGMRVARRGMTGPTVAPGTPIQECAHLFPAEGLRAPGIVDYIVGAAPAPGVFIFGTHADPVQQHYLKYYKLGDGPFYCFFVPYHLCHLETHNSIARAAIFRDATLAPIGPPQVDVIATAKRDLPSGTVLDGLGGYDTYGLAENSPVVKRDRLLPIGLAEGCTLVRDVARDQVLTYDDLRLPPDRLCDRLRSEQDAELVETTT